MALRRCDFELKRTACGVSCLRSNLHRRSMRCLPYVLGATTQADAAAKAETAVEPGHSVENRALANKQNFTLDEWTQILESTMSVGMAVSAADPSGLWGALKEAFASSSSLASAKMDASSNELVKAVVAEFETPEGRAAQALCGRQA